MKECDCKYLIKSKTKLPFGPFGKMTSKTVMCAIKKDTIQQDKAAIINNSFSELTNNDVAGPTCFYYNSELVQCSQCPYYQSNNEDE